MAGGEPRDHRHGLRHRCNNDHGLSPDGTQLVISDQSQERSRSRIYTLPVGGGTPQPFTEWPILLAWLVAGWTDLAYCAERDGEFDIYTIPATAARKRG